MKQFLLASCMVLGVSVFSQSYCIPEFPLGCTGGDVIDNFDMPTASFSDHNTGCSTGQYSDFTNKTITLSPGITYPFTATHGYAYQHFKIWIDYNNDGTFNETTELAASVLSNTVNGVDTSSGSVVVPSSTPIGNYRMRVATRFNNDPIPCNTAGYGEAHDYTLHVGAPPSCLSPSSLTASSLGSATATISWVASTSAVGVGYEYYLSNTNSTPSVTTPATGSVAATVTSKVLSGLTPETVYYAWVRSACSSTDKSAWSSSVMFKTLCQSTIPAYTNDFSTFPGNCWTQALGGSVAIGSTTSGSNWYEDGFLNSGFTGAAKINIYSFGTTENVGWLKSNPFNLSSGGYRVKFDYGVTDYANSDPSAMGSDDYVQFVISSNGGTTWSVLQTWNAANSPTNTSTTFSMNIPTYVGANTIFAFIGSNGIVADAEDYEFFVDNFIVESANLSTSEFSSAKNIIKVYPNPFAEILTISEVKNVKSVSVIDVAGRVVKTIDKPSAELQLSELQSGLYMVIVTMNDGSKETIKAIKK